MSEYLKNLYSKSEEEVTEAFNNFFNAAYSEAEKEKTLKLEKELKKLQTDCQNKQDEILNEYSKCYRNKYERAVKYNIGKYVSRQNETFYFSIPSGQKIELDNLPDVTEDNTVIYDLYSKNGGIRTLEGYVYDLASVVEKIYTYHIAGDNNSCKFILNEEIIKPFLSDTKNTRHLRKSYDKSYDTSGDTFPKIPGKAFLTKLYGLQPEQVKLRYSLNDYFRFNKYNQSFELILKTCDPEIMDDLLDMNVPILKQIHELIGCEKQTYKKAKDEHLTKELFEVAEFFQAKDKFNITEEEWLELIKELKLLEEDINFYKIQMETTSYYYYGKNRIQYRTPKNTILISQLARKYAVTDSFFTNYSFRKFCKYVIDESINQGYASLEAFMQELEDYLRMCQSKSIKPTLYTSTLKMTHDIAARNHNITVSPEQEIMFAERYKDYKDIKLKNDYIIVKPTNTTSIQLEGDNLNHCCASYIKRIIDGESLILFLRKQSNTDQSLVTLELKDNKVITQARGMSNRQPNEEELQAIKEYAEKEKLEIKY